MKIEVTEEDIKNGLQHHGHLCPIGLAIARHLKDGFGVHVCSIRSIEIWQGTSINVIHSVKHVPEAEQFVEAFDHDMLVQPFSFELEGLDEFIRPPGIPEVGELNV